MELFTNNWSHSNLSASLPIWTLAIKSSKSTIHAQPEQLTFSEILFLDAGAGSTEENTNRHALSLSLTSGKIRAETDHITSITQGPRRMAPEIFYASLAAPLRCRPQRATKSFFLLRMCAFRLA
jgi:hypothetical protein